MFPANTVFDSHQEPNGKPPKRLCVWTDAYVSCLSTNATSAHPEKSHRTSGRFGAEEFQPLHWDLRDRSTERRTLVSELETKADTYPCGFGHSGHRFTILNELSFNLHASTHLSEPKPPGRKKIGVASKPLSEPKAQRDKKKYKKKSRCFASEAIGHVALQAVHVHEVLEAARGRGRPSRSNRSLVDVGFGEQKFSDFSS